ncbi:hypothetical protein [Bacillus cereus]|uniref:hypothetical protein n=1 Tax=Bacillus cereus TaxID=1396 RepID=UPI001F5BF76C|nr:hypothetical protein [Bacillus cereus]
MYGIGTNTGIKRVSSGDASMRYKALLYVKRKYIDERERYKATNIIKLLRRK